MSTRRMFLRRSTAVLSAAFVPSRLWLPRELGSPNEKLNLGVIGVGNRGANNLDGVASENIVALCDVDERFLGKAHERFPRAATYHDFRKLLERNDLDGVVVSTPDHTHAVATCAALRAGLHVYCEKPLTHSVSEARTVMRLAKESGKITQMGTQIHALENYRRVVELVRSGAIGAVDECHVWCGKTWSGGTRPKETPAVPAHLHWDLWLGPAPERPYHPAYVPENWRRWWDFGQGTLGDMGCHYMDLAQWALELGHPDTIGAEGGKLDPETAPPDLVVRYTFPARGDWPRVAVTWYDTDQRPPQIRSKAIPPWDSGVLFVGKKGMLLADYTRRELLPQKAFADFEAPAPSIPPSPGHHREWIDGCKSGKKTSCDFSYAGVLTETVLLGNVAFRAGAKIEWDAEKMRASGSDRAERFIQREYREGWQM